MKKLFRNRPFGVGFIVGLSLAILVNTLSYVAYRMEVEKMVEFRRQSDLHMSIIYYIGLPFPFYQGQLFVFPALVVDILIFAIFSVTVGLVFRWVATRMSRQVPA